jgi:hypothetical protein
VNRDPEAAPALIARLFAKPAPVSKRGLKAKRESWTVAALQEFRRRVDLCLWIEALSDFSVTSYYLSNPLLRDELERLTGLGLDTLIPMEPAA